MIDISMHINKEYVLFMETHALNYSQLSVLGVTAHK